MGRDMIGCTREINKKIAEYSNAKDVEGLRLVRLKGLVTGGCHHFKKGDEVTVLEHSAWHNTTRVRVAGTLGEFGSALCRPSARCALKPFRHRRTDGHQRCQSSLLPFRRHATTRQARL
jgi:hypothetical protein